MDSIYKRANDYWIQYYRNRKTYHEPPKNKKGFGNTMFAKPCYSLVPELGIEPRRGRPRGILSRKMTIFRKPVISATSMISLAFFIVYYVGKC